jgi:hypothetical protein
MQQSALLFAMNYTASNKETFLKNFWLKSKRSVLKATTEGPAAYVLDQTARPNEAAALCDLLRMHGVEVQRLSKETEVAGVKHPEGSYVVRMDQPYSRLADMLLDKQFYNPNDTPPYDDTGWTVQALRNLKSVRVTDVGILKAAMTPVGERAAPEGRVVGEGNTFVVAHNGDRVLATFRFKLQDVKFAVAEEGFEAAGRKFGAGAMIVTGGDVRSRVAAAAAELGVTVYALSEPPKVATHALAAPRIALVHTWTNTQNEGWFRLALETSGIPYTYISDQKLRGMANLREQFDVIVFGPVQGSSQRVVNGMPMRGEAIAWKAGELTPNLATSPDQTDDIRGGMGLAGLLNVQRFVEAGGLFVTVGANASIPIDYGLIEGVSIAPARELKARGSVLDSVVADAKSPIVYGYGERLPVYFNVSPILEVGGGAAFGGGGGGGAAPGVRVSGRGGVSDPDIPQGRPPAPPVAGGGGPEISELQRSLQPSPAERPRTVLRFADEKELLISGMLAGGRELAGKPAVVDVPSGKGHYLLFAINPMWRQQTQGSYMLLLNAAMNFENLGVGRPVPARVRATAADDLQ